VKRFFKNAFFAPSRGSKTIVRTALDTSRSTSVASHTNGMSRDEGRLFSADIASRTVESIIALDTEWPLRALYFTTLLICLTGIAAIFVVKVDVSAMGEGLIRPLTDKIEITSPLAGQVVEVIGKADLRVNRGDRLMV